MSHKPNILELEFLRSELIEKTLYTNSNFLRLFLYQNYFEKILSLNNPNLEEAFLKEFLDDYVSCISKFEVWGVEPDITNKLLEQFNKVASLKVAVEILTSLNSEIERIEKQSEKLSLILEGKDVEDGEPHKAFFPLIDKDAAAGFYGIIESVTVRINKSEECDKFIIIPSEKEIEKKIIEQCETSWQLALSLSKQYVKKPNKFHEVIISFDKKEGIYEGNSLGISLTLSILEQLLMFYNPAYIIKIKELSAFTGGVTEPGTVLTTGEEIIKQKVAAVFFSEINSFAFPKSEENYVRFALAQLKNQYPKRALKIIPVEDVYDVLNRRDLVEIKKRNPVVRTGKFVKKNWITFSLLIVITAMAYFTSWWDFDDNPVKLQHKGRFLYVMNKNEKVLWKKFMFYDAGIGEGVGQLRISAKIIDINSDGINEVIIANEADTTKNNYGNCITRIACYNNYGDSVWTYRFKDKVSTPFKEFSNHYWPNLIDIVKEGDQNVLYCFAYHIQFYPGVIFKLDANTGQRLSGAFWHTGRISDCYIGDFNEDDELELVATGTHNGYESNFIFSVDLRNLEGTAPSVYNYKFFNKEITSFNNYVQIPITDLARFQEFRYGNIRTGSLIYAKSTKSFRISIEQGFNQSNIAAMNFIFDKNLNLIDIDCADAMQTIRDSLVVKGELDLPYTNTPEYFNSLKQRILYWDGERFVRDYKY